MLRQGRLPRHHDGRHRRGGERVQGNPYLYFPGKEALFIALYEEWDCGLAARVDAIVSGLAEPARRSPRTVLAAVASAIADHVTGNPQTCKVLMEATTLAAYEPAIATKVQAANAASLDQLTGLFTASSAAGQWPADTDPALRARLFMAGLYGLMSQWHTAPGSFPLEAAMSALAGTSGAVTGDHCGDAQNQREAHEPCPGMGGDVPEHHLPHQPRQRAGMRNFGPLLGDTV
jgi:AcrR family transcriptional regulator